MKVIIEGRPEEIAALVAAIQERRREMSQEEWNQMLSDTFKDFHLPTTGDTDGGRQKA